MDKAVYRVYCKGILGVKTNISGFSWVYGSAAPDVSEEEYDACVIKMTVWVVPEKKMPRPTACDRRFQAYTWDNSKHTISCRRTLMRTVDLGYDIQIDGNNINVVVGKNYYRLIKNRTMNLHGMYYLLADLANIMLLKNGYLTLYASAAFCESENRCAINFAPPNTGKTYTVTNLCSRGGYQLVSEDVAITDGTKVYSCPWTCSYRRTRSAADSAGSLGRVKEAMVGKFRDSCDMTDLVVLSRGKNKYHRNKEEILSQICILNGYLFQYYCSPIVKLLAYFCEEFRVPWNDFAEKMIEDMVTKAECAYIRCEDPADYAEMIHQKLMGIAI